MKGITWGGKRPQNQHRVGCSTRLTSALLEVTTSCQDQLLKGDQERELPVVLDTLQPPLAFLPLGTSAPHEPSHSPQPFGQGWGGTQGGHRVPKPCLSSHPRAAHSLRSPTPDRPTRHLQGADHGPGSERDQPQPYLPILGSGNNSGTCQPVPTARPQPPKATAQARPFHRCSAFGWPPVGDGRRRWVG